MPPADPIDAQTDAQSDTRPPAPVVILSPDGAATAGTLTVTPPPGPPPLVSCAMISRGRPFPALLAIESYRRQTYRPRELVIVTAAIDGALAAAVAALGDETIRCETVADGTLGELRNAAVARSRGGIICTWDDDDLSDPERIAYGVAALDPARAAAAMLLRTCLWWPARRRLVVTRRRTWEMTMLARRGALPVYRAVGPGEDTTAINFMRAMHPLVLVDRPFDYVRVVSTNICAPAHFEWLLDTAEADYAGDAYEAMLATLAERMPIAAYLAGLSGGS